MRYRMSFPRTWATERFSASTSLKATGVADVDGDKAFDAEDFGEPPALPGLAVVKL